jgi:hypothetical protein
MPLVVIQYKRLYLNEDMIHELAKHLPEIVADALDAGQEGNNEARLFPGEVKVLVQEPGKLDVNTRDLEIIIWANSYPERLKNLEQRKNKIVRGVRKALGNYSRNLSGFVWVLLQHGAFGRF